jgi:hypothetical protein
MPAKVRPETVAVLDFPITGRARLTVMSGSSTATSTTPARVAMRSGPGPASFSSVRNRAYARTPLPQNSASDPSAFQ